MNLINWIAAPIALICLLTAAGWVIYVLWGVTQAVASWLWDVGQDLSREWRRVRTTRQMPLPAESAALSAGEEVTPSSTRD